ncbi:MAG: OmpH family outer membrane protein [Thermohalobaculum sp.]|nr:OmpH family outer membrane protein [Thermohalobaculum sp.]
MATEALQREIDAVKAALTAEEEELTRLRATLPRDAFDARVAAFDQRVREERRMAQSRAAALQRAYRDARRQLVDALGGVLEELRLELGALAILDAEGVLAVDPSIDVTARAIALFDDRISVPVVVMPVEPGSRSAPDRTPEMAQPVPGLHSPNGSGADASGLDESAAPGPAAEPGKPGAD